QCSRPVCVTSAVLATAAKETSRPTTGAPHETPTAERPAPEPDTEAGALLEAGEAGRIRVGGEDRRGCHHAHLRSRTRRPRGTGEPLPGRPHPQRVVDCGTVRCG